MKRLILALLFVTTIPLLADDDDDVATEQVPSVDEGYGEWEQFQNEVDPYHDMP